MNVFFSALTAINLKNNLGILSNTSISQNKKITSMVVDITDRARAACLPNRVMLGIVMASMVFPIMPDGLLISRGIKSAVVPFQAGHFSI